MDCEPSRALNARVKLPVPAPRSAQMLLGCCTAARINSTISSCLIRNNYKSSSGCHIRNRLVACDFLYAQQVVERATKEANSVSILCFTRSLFHANRCACVWRLAVAYRTAQDTYLAPQCQTHRIRFPLANRGVQ